MNIVSISDVYSGQRVGLDEYLRICERLGNPAIVATLSPGRCGSTWFARLIEGTGRCGRGEEIFNERTAERWRAEGADFAQYFEATARKEIVGGVLWFQITPARFRQVGRLLDDRIARMWNFTVLLRRDILSQAISYVYAVRTGIWHSTQTEAKVEIDANAEDVAEDVERRLRNLLKDEEDIKRLVDEHAGGGALIQYYEDIVAGPQEEILRLFEYLNIGIDISNILPPAQQPIRKLEKSGSIDLYYNTLKRLDWLGPLLSQRKNSFYTSSPQRARNAPMQLQQSATIAVAHTANQASPKLVAQLESAIELARTGRKAEARAMVAFSAADAPQDVNVLHKAGVVLKLCGAYDEALPFFQQALAVRPNFHFTESEIAGLYADLGQLGEGLRWYRKTIASQPRWVLPYWRAAQLALQLGRSREGLELLESACAIDPTNRESQVRRAQFLVYMNRRDEAASVYERLLANGPAKDDEHVSYLMLLSETGKHQQVIAHCATLNPAPGSRLYLHAHTLAGNAKLAVHHDLGAVIARAAAREAGSQWKTAPGVEEAIRSAIGARRPFSMIRLGDGEARFLVYTCHGLRDLLTPAEAFCTGESIWTNWFGDSLRSAGVHDVTRLLAVLVASIDGADILGMPMADRMRRDHRHVGYLAHLDEFVSHGAPNRPNVFITDASVHIELHRISPFLRNILVGVETIGVISPHRDLGPRFAAALGIPQVMSHVVPGEMRLPVRQDHVRGSGHFPEGYHKLMASIAVPRPGTVFLVAAGLLGKIYCGRIKQLGGIAIDVGAMADAWMGFTNTRPGHFDAQTEWVLP